MKKVTICAAIGAIFICEGMHEKTAISMEQDNPSKQTGNFEKVICKGVAVDSDFIELNGNCVNECEQGFIQNIGSEQIWKN